MYKKMSSWLTIASVLFMGDTYALDGASAVHKNNDVVFEEARRIMHVEPDFVEQTPIAGLYQVGVGADVIYMSSDGRYLIRGDLIDNKKAKSLANLTEVKKRGLRLKILQGLNKDDFITFKAKQYKTHIYVFTDVTCGYSKKLHQDINSLNDAGIEVRYAAFPRQGLESESFKIHESIWCSADRNQAITASNNGDKITSVSCKNPVAKQYALAKKLNIYGTPTLILADGSIVPGYIPKEELIKAVLPHEK